MRVAAIYDIHGNLAALEAVLEEIRQVGADRIVVGGDVVPGPMPRETLSRLRDVFGLSGSGAFGLAKHYTLRYNVWHGSTDPCPERHFPPH